MKSGDRSQESSIALLTTVQTEASERISRLLDELFAGATAEQERAADLANALALAKAELDVARAERDLAIADTREATAREAKLREELVTLRNQYQHIVDTQTLQLLELTRELTTNTPAPAALAPATRVRGASERDEIDDLSFDAIEAALAASPL